MARGMSGRGAYWLGALIGLIFSGALAAGLSIAAPLLAPEAMNDSTVGIAPPAASGAETREVEPEPNPEPTPAVVAPTGPEPEAEPAAGAAPEPTSGASGPAAPSGGAETGEPEPAPPAEAAPAAPEGETTAPADGADATPTEGRPSAEAPPARSPAISSSPAVVSPTVGAPEAAPDLPRYEAFAASFDGDASEPLLAIVLTGAGAAGGGADALGDVMLLTGPVAISVAPDAADPAAMAEKLRAAGYEALAGRTGETAAANLNGAGPVIGVALLDAGPGLDVGALLDAVAAEGAALVDLTAEGGAAPYRMAHSKGLPAAPAGRRIDEIANSDMVYQALERAAFDARRTGAYLAVGEASPAVISGVRRWMNVKAGISVDVAPLSAVIAKMRR